MPCYCGFLDCAASLFKLETVDPGSVTFIQLADCSYQEPLFTLCGYGGNKTRVFSIQILVALAALANLGIWEIQQDSG
jgi:hypothetical protein